MDGIPGFIFDREKNRYYRIHVDPRFPNQGENRLNGATNPFENLQPKLKAKGVKKRFTLSDALTVRQDGRSIGPKQWKNEMMRHVLQRLQTSYSRKVLDENGSEMRHLHGVRALGNGSYVGAWSKLTARLPEFFKVRVLDDSDDKRGIRVDVSNVTRIGHLGHHLVVDIQYVELNTNNVFLMYVANSTVRRDNVFEIIRCPVENDAENENSLNFAAKYHLQGALRCCSYNMNKNIFMVGTERGVLCRSLDGDFSLIPAFYTDSHCLEFTKKGDTVYCGHDNGLLSLIDMRTTSVCKIDEFASVISKVHILNDEYKIIVNTFDTNLLLYDVRKNKAIHNFRGHVNYGRRMPVSFSEKADILCASGHDSRIRFWSLSTGEPICCLPPISEKYFSLSVLHETPKRISAHVFSNENIYILDSHNI